LALEAGIMSLALTLGVFVGPFIPGILGLITMPYEPYDTKYHPFLIFAASILATIGTGLTSLLTPGSTRLIWISSQAMLGIGIGTGVHIPAFYAMAHIPDEEKSRVYGATLMIEALLASVFHSVAQSIFVNTLQSSLKARIPTFDLKILLHTGVTTLATSSPSEQQHLVLLAYNTALINVFYLGAALFGFSILGTFVSLIHHRRRARKVRDNELSLIFPPITPAITQISRHNSVSRDLRIGPPLAMTAPPACLIPIAPTEPLMGSFPATGASNTV
jgi:hypothetical protein